jgi:nitroreductase
MSTRGDSRVMASAIGESLMDIQEAISQRRAVREYTPEPVNRQTLIELIKSATLAPSAVNEQAWRFTVVTDRALLSRISRSAKAHMLSESGESTAAGHFHDILSDIGFNIFYGAPALVVISAPKRLRWVIEDCSLAAENFMLAARANNLGTCWIGFAQSWLGTPEGRNAIKLDDDQLPVAPIIVGHPSVMPPPVPRKEPEIRWIG